MGECGPASAAGGGGVRVPLRRDGRFAKRPYGGGGGVGNATGLVRVGALRQAQGERNRESALRCVVLFLHGAEGFDLPVEVGLLAVDEEGVDEEGYPRYGEGDEEEREKVLLLGVFRAQRREQEEEGRK